VFFFTVGDTYKPIGFIETASPVVSMEWSKKGKVKISVWYISLRHFQALVSYLL